jgi:hypothetical protein
LTTVAITETVPVAVVFNTLLPAAIVAPVVPGVVTVQTIAWFVAFDGTTVPVNGNAVPAVAVVGTPVILVTGTKGFIAYIGLSVQARKSKTADKNITESTIFFIAAPSNYLL